MAIVPQRRTGKKSKRLRRSHLALDVPGLTACPNCGEMKRSHNICRACGYYDGRQVLAPKGEEVVAEETAKQAKPKKATKTSETKSTKKPTKEAEVKEKVETKNATK